MFGTCDRYTSKMLLILTLLKKYVWVCKCIKSHHSYGGGDQVFSFECKELSKTGLRREFHFNLPNLDQVMNWGPTAEGFRKEMVNTQITCILLLCDWWRCSPNWLSHIKSRSNNLLIDLAELVITMASNILPRWKVPLHYIILKSHSSFLSKKDILTFT